MMKSIWSDMVTPPEFGTLNGDTKTDVLIIGGGMTGILCAYMLKKAGVDYLLVEADRICSGTTGNTTAKVTYQHGLIYDKMLRRFGRDTTRLYMEAQKNALEKYRELSKKFPCNFEECDSYVYSRSSKENLSREVSALREIGCDAELVTEVNLPFFIEGAVRIRNQAQFNPLEFAFSVAKDLNILENTKVVEFTPDAITTKQGKIKAKKTIVTTHFPFLNKHGSYFLKMFQHRSYVVALENASDVKGIFVDENEKGLSFRNYNGLLFVGGGGHRTGKKGGGWNEIEAFAKKYYPDARVVYRWATQDCMTLDNIPYIGQYSANTTNLYTATGFNKWGMTSAMTAAMILSDLVQEKDNKYAKVFSPSRSILRPQLAINAAEALMGIVRFSTPRCPHLGCALKYNSQEHSWDCSCHGSRFDEAGKVINNPSNDDIII